MVLLTYSNIIQFVDGNGRQSPPRQWSKKKVLYVDDNSLVRLLLEMILRTKWATAEVQMNYLELNLP